MMKKGIAKPAYQSKFSPYKLMMLLKKDVISIGTRIFRCWLFTLQNSNGF
jgi:hypothetical protein